MKKLLLAIAIMSVFATYAQQIDFQSATFNASDYIQFKPVTDPSQITVFNEDQNWGYNHNNIHGYLICGQVNGGNPYSISTEETTYTTKYRGKTIVSRVLKTVDSNFNPDDNNIYLAIPKAGEAPSHNHQEFYIGSNPVTETIIDEETNEEKEVVNPNYYFWTMVDGNIVYLVTDDNYSLFLESRADADANGHKYYMSVLNVGGPGVNVGAGSDESGNKVIRRETTQPKDATLRINGQTVRVFEANGTNPNFFFANNADLSYNGKSGMAQLYASDAGMTTGVERVAAEEADAPAEYYNLQGVRVDNPSNGVYILRKGSTTKKVLVK